MPKFCGYRKKREQKKEKCHRENESPTLLANTPELEKSVSRAEYLMKGLENSNALASLGLQNDSNATVSHDKASLQECQKNKNFMDCPRHRKFSDVKNVNQ